jgi:formylglycine-generating enzyme required for sulfatase activity
MKSEILPIICSFFSFMLSACSSYHYNKSNHWQNSLGMNFVKVPGIPGFVCQHETRVQDYRRFVSQTHRPWPSSGFTQNRRHPAVNINWEDAQAFCLWLSRKESRRYRLPTDAEWSRLAGLDPQQDHAACPQKQPQHPGQFPWGQGLLDSTRGNLCDQAFGRKLGDGYQARWLEQCDDGYAYTAPVCSFQPNAYGLYDVSGNVWEWCQDWYDSPKNLHRVLRGASWRTGNIERIWSSYRGPDPPKCRLDSAGFRIVVE